MGGGGSVRAMVAGLACLVLGACGHPHPVPADGLTGDLQGGIMTTLQAMGGQQLDARSISDEATQLAWSTQPDRIALVRSGQLSGLSLGAQASVVLRRIRHGGSSARPPQVLDYLIAHAAQLDLQQRLLLEAVRAQCALELPPTR